MATRVPRLPLRWIKPSARKHLSAALLLITAGCGRSNAPPASASSAAPSVSAPITEPTVESSDDTAPTVQKDEAAAKSIKEASYHLHHARDWLVRMGDGTDESHARVQAAVDHLMPYTEEFWTISPAEGAAVAAHVAVDVWALRPAWDAIVNDALAEATLTRPNFHGYVTEGKVGLHSEHLGFLLAEMQSLARAYPNGVW